MLVSVCLITYKQEEYIAEAIESIFRQQTGFSFELIIGEDNSPDSTRQICQQYADKYPDQIRLLPGEKNLGMLKNFMRTIAAACGKYIAFLEGDDYWTDPRKLQKQVDFLEQNPGYSICFHNVQVKSIKKGIEGEWLFHKSLEKTVFTTEDLLRQWFIPSASVVFVNYPDLELPSWFSFCKSGDIPFLLLLSLRGKIKYIDETMAVYRVHEKGISSSHNGYDKIIAMIYIYENFNVHTGYYYRDKIREAIIYEMNYHFPREQLNIKEEPKAEIKRSLLVRVYQAVRGLLLNYGS